MYDQRTRRACTYDDVGTVLAVDNQCSNEATKDLRDDVSRNLLPREAYQQQWVMSKELTIIENVRKSSPLQTAKAMVTAGLK